MMFVCFIQGVYCIFPFLETDIQVNNILIFAQEIQMVKWNPNFYQKNNVAEKVKLHLESNVTTLLVLSSNIIDQDFLEVGWDHTCPGDLPTSRWVFRDNSTFPQHYSHVWWRIGVSRKLSLGNYCTVGKISGEFAKKTKWSVLHQQWCLSSLFTQWSNN